MSYLPNPAVQGDPPYTIEIEIDDEYTSLVNPANLAAAVTATLRHQAVTAGQVTVVLTGDEQVAALNHEYRGIHAPTDVLSFAAQAPGDSPALALPAELAIEMATYLGDVVIAYPYAARQAAQYQVPVDAELRLLAVHGTLHLLGFDHDTAEAEVAMWALQEEVLASLGDLELAQNLSQRQYEE
jgi:probable rRNA maturation factor